MLIALQNDPPTNQSRCYTAKHGGHSPQAGRLIKPFEQQEPRRHPLVERFSTPGKYDPPHLERLKADLALGRAELPRVRATVSTGPASARVQRALTSLQTFDGIDSDASAYDANVAAGPNELVMVTNFTAAILSKTGGSPQAPISLMAWFSSVLPNGVNKVFDPRILYDQHDQRWVLAASGAHYDDFTSGVQLLSVSCTSNPRADWWVWAFPEIHEDGKPWWPDHPMLGVDAHALYLSANLYVGTTGKPGDARLRVMPKAGAYTGGVAAYTEFERLLSPEDSEHTESTPRVYGLPVPHMGSTGRPVPRQHTEGQDTGEDADPVDGDGSCR